MDNNSSGKSFIQSTSQGINPLGYAWFVSENKIVENANDEIEAFILF